jgi:Ser-tRNA(Ala) deacylase AlaX
VVEIPSFERDPYRTTLDAEVVRTGEEGGHPFVVLSDTILYPEGGGQPSDHGTLNGVPVLDVERRQGEIRHALAAPVPLGPAAVRLDWSRRYDHMQQHTGQHLLTAVAQDRFAWETTAFHLGGTVCDVELSAPKLLPHDLTALEEAVAAEIRAARPVRARRAAREELAMLKVRTRGLPEGHEGTIRLVEIVGVDLNTCGGTHVSCTSEIEVVKLLATEALRGGTRLFFTCGGRARARLGAHEERSAALRKALGAPDEGLVAAALEKLEKLRMAEKELRVRDEAEARQRAAAFSRDDAPVVGAVFAGKSAAFLRSLSKEFLLAAPSKIGLFTATEGHEAIFVLAAGAEVALDVTATGREVAELLGGKGGGSGRLFQGKAASLAGFDAAVGRLRDLVA